MTSVFSMNANRDIHAIGGRLQIARDREAVLQTCERVIRANFSEMIYAANRGVNYFRDVFGASPNVINFEAGARAQLSRVPDVTGIESFTAEVQGDQVVYSATIRTTFGAGTITNETVGGA